MTLLQDKGPFVYNRNNNIDTKCKNKGQNDMKQIEIRRSKRKTMSLEVTADARVIVRAPLFISQAEIERFVNSKKAWLEKSLQKVQERQALKYDSRKLTEKELELLAEQAKQVFSEKAAYFAKKVGVTYGRITIRNQRTRWGSCSSQGNLNFNCLLLFAPEAVQDYVVVHELCHRKEMNHSDRFWREVAKVMPDYRVHKKWLKEHGSKIMSLNC